MDGEAVWVRALDGTPGFAGADPESRTGWMDLAGRCEAPIAVGLWSRPLFRPEQHPVVGRLREFVRSGGSLELKVRCRRCFDCRRARLVEWLARFVAEWRAAPRTWFCTFTFNSEFLQANAGREEEAVSEELKRAFKRMRKGLVIPYGYKGADRAVPPVTDFRYLAVLERGEVNGRLHWHVLIHGSCRWIQIRAGWHAGHMQAKLLPKPSTSSGKYSEQEQRALQGAYYVLKYVTKTSRKLRPSLHYGSPPDKDQDVPSPRDAEVLTSAQRSGGATPTPTFADAEAVGRSTPTIPGGDFGGGVSPPHCDPAFRGRPMAEFAWRRECESPLPGALGDEIPF